jgi:hypothetical protein
MHTTAVEVVCAGMLVAPPLVGAIGRWVRAGSGEARRGSFGIATECAAQSFAVCSPLDSEEGHIDC